jgi:hypothetical protein
MLTDNKFAELEFEKKFPERRVMGNTLSGLEECLCKSGGTSKTSC